MPCAYHPERKAVDTCSDCGKQVCQFCKVIVDGKTRCPDCVEKTCGSPKITAQGIKEAATSRPSHYHIGNGIPWGWILLLVFLGSGATFIAWISGNMISSSVNSGPQGLASTSTSNLAPLPTSAWVGPDGEREYEYVSCGANCYYVGADMEPIVLVNNPDAKDPTWAELKNFLVVDQTDYSSYVYGSFTCGDFAEVLHNNAEMAGIRAAWVAVDFYSGGIGHANNAFNTTDQGLVYIDDTGIQDTEEIRNSGCARDRKASVSIGNEYTTESIFFCVWYDEWESLGIVSSIGITW